MTKNELKEFAFAFDEFMKEITKDGVKENDENTIVTLAKKYVTFFQKGIVCEKQGLPRWIMQDGWIAYVDDHYYQDITKLVNDMNIDRKYVNHIIQPIVDGMTEIEYHFEDTRVIKIKCVRQIENKKFEQN